MTHPLLHRVFALIYKHVGAVTWPALLAMVVAHLLISWLGFALVGEDKAAEADTFWYFYVVTATTIGYGDVSPATVPGRLITVLWIIPGGIALFTAVITKLVQSIARVWNRRMNGLGDYADMEHHLVIMGWNLEKTPRLVHLFLADQRYDHGGIVLVARGLDRNPLAEHVRFVKVEELPSDDALKRSGAARAEAVVAMGADDNETLAIGLSVGTLEPPPRIVAHFNSEIVAALLRTHCPSAECSVSLSVEMLARSAQDPGSSEVHRQILSPLDSPTQFRLVVPPRSSGFLYGDAMAFFKERYDATVIAVHRTDGRIDVNAASQTPVSGGDALFFLAAHRLRVDDVDWPACAAAGARQGK